MLKYRMVLAGGAVLLAAGVARAQDAAPLAPYVPPATQSPLAPLPDAATPDQDPPLGDVKLRSDSSSNISAADTRSPIAPILPEPGAAGDSAADFLRAARSAITAGRTGEAQEALERAESRMLSRDVAPSEAGTQSGQQGVAAVSAARQALSVGNAQAAVEAIDQALRGG